MNLPVMLYSRYRRLSWRSKAVGAFAATSLAARFAGGLAQLLQVPIALKALGPEAFGLWMALVSLGSMITFADFGVGQGAQNRLAEAFAAGDMERARAICGNTVSVLLAIGAVLAAAVLVVAPRLDAGALFGLADPAVRRAAPSAITVTLLLFAVNFPLCFAQRLAYSLQKGWMHNVAQGIGGVGALAGTILAVHENASLAGIIAAAQSPLILAYAGLLALLLARLGWLDRRLLRWKWATLRPLLRLGACFGIQQAHLVLILSLPQILISTTLGAAAVTPYNLAQRLFNLFAIIQNAFMLPLWPAYSDANARGDFRWIRRMLGWSLAATGACTILPMALGSWFARPLLILWVGARTALPGPLLVWLLFAWNALVFVEQPFGYLLAGMSEVRKITFYAAVSAVLSAGLMVALVRRHGQAGVVLGMIAGYLPYLLLGNLAEAHRVLKGRFSMRGAGARSRPPGPDPLAVAPDNPGGMIP